MDGYSPHEHRPLRGYAALALVYDAGLLALCVAAARHEDSLPRRLPAADLVLLSAATQKLSRTIAKDKVTSFLRAPFTRYGGSAGPSEVSEEPRGTGLRLAVGELLGCPFCLGQWVATGLVAGYLWRPRTTRMAAGIFTVSSAADFIQLAYAAAEERT